MTLSADPAGRGDAVERLEQVDGANWREFLQAETAVLMLARSGCPACAEWTDELEQHLGDNPGDYPQVRFGKIVLDRPGLDEFKQAHAWMAREVDVVPYTVIFRRGERAKAFPGGGMGRLESRLRRLL